VARAAWQIRMLIPYRPLAKPSPFTIVSNNCWGAHVYRLLDEPYHTPFIGLFLAPACYVALAQNFRATVRRPLRFQDSSRHAYINALRAEEGLNYPIGVLDHGIEIQFLHYASEAEAREKWSRRVERIVKDDSRLFFKFCERDGCTREDLRAFDALPFSNKVCFVSKPMPVLKSAVWIPESRNGQVPHGGELSEISSKYFDTLRWLKRARGTAAEKRLCAVG
jgi:uncharacterized protein (DUF1919 family)